MTMKVIPITHEPPEDASLDNDKSEVTVITEWSSVNIVEQRNGRTIIKIRSRGISGCLRLDYEQKKIVQFSAFDIGADGGVL